MRSVAHNLVNMDVFASDMNVDMQYQVVLMHSTGHPVLRRSTEVNWGQMRSMTFAYFFRGSTAF